MSASVAVAAPLSRSPQRKSPPPSPLNLDQLRPEFPPAPVHHAPPAPATPGGTTTSFVFTSSRTKQQPPGSPFVSTSTARAPSPNKPCRPRSPVSPTASVSTASTVRNSHRAKATLTPTQLARHGEGAMDSRRILGPNMRAAGFVHLSNSVKSSPASSPGWQEIPGPSNYMGTAPLQLTPTDPPPFPPIMFVAPTAVQQVSMWDYQMWPSGHAHVPPSSSAHTDVRPHLPADGAKPTQVRSVSEGHAMASAGLGVLHARALSHSPYPFGSSPAASHSSGPSHAQGRSISNSSSSTKFSLEGRRAATKGKDREFDDLEVLEEYPFPRTPPSPSSRASDSSGPVSRFGRDSEEKSQAPVARANGADSSEVASHAARTHDRSARSSQPHSKPYPKDKDHDRPKERDRDRDKRKGRDRVATHLTECTQEQLNIPGAARSGVNITPPRTKPRAHELSFSELCEPGFAWSTANPDIFAPVHGPRALESTAESPSPPTELEKESPEPRTSALEAVPVPAEKERHREQRREEKKHIAGLVAAHRERDEDHVRYVAAEREREREEREGKKGEERPRRLNGGSGRTSPVPAIMITKEREHRERERTSPGHKERKSRRHSPKHLHAVHKTKSVFSDITSVSDAETMVGDANANAGDVLVA